MKCFRRYFVFLVFGFCFLPYLMPVFASRYTIEKIEVDKGLSNNQVLSIAEDKDGFLWFATNWGLNRFDSKSFTVFKNQTADTTSIADNGINKILYDKKHNKLWIATKRKGLNAFDYSTQQFIRYPAYQETPNSTKAYGITDLCLDSNGDLLMGTYGNGLKKLLIEKDSVVHYNKIIQQQFIWTVADDHNGTIYMGDAGSGLNILSLKDGSVKVFLHDPNNPNSIPNNVVHKIHIDSGGKVWVGTDDGLALFSPETENFIVFKHDKNNLNSLSDHAIQSLGEVNGSLWIGTDKGVNILDLQQNVIENPNNVKFSHIVSSDLPSGLSNGHIRAIFQDSFGNVWMATDRGINVISHIEPFFNNITYSTIKSDVDALSEKNAQSICFDDKHGTLWVGTEGGGIDVYKNKKKIAHYGVEKNNLPDNTLLTGLVDSNGDIWFGTATQGIIRLNKKTNKFEKIKIRHNSEPYVVHMFEDNSKKLWLAAYGGIYKYNLSDGEITYFDGSKVLIPSNLFRSISQDADGNFWFGSLIDGLIVTTPGFELIKHISGQVNNINHIYCDSSQNMWVATLHGAFMFPPHEPDYAYYSLNKENGISDEYIHAITEGEKGEIWLSTNTGISRYSTTEKKFDNYDYLAGIPTGGGFFNRSVAKSADGTVFFGSQYGVCFFDSEQDILAYQMPQVVITDVSVYGTKKSQSNNSVNVLVASPIKLKYNQNTFTVTFNVLDYSLKDLVEYSYSLKGFDDLWYQTNGQQQVTFRNLAPGKYTFCVKSRILTQEWNEKSTSIEIEIIPPFWLTWWAKTFYGLVSCAVILFIIWYYVEKRNHKKEQELNNEKLHFYTNVAHELKTPLTLILSPLTDLMNNEKMQQEDMKKISLIHKSATRLFDLINQIMEFRKSETNNRKLCIQKGDISKLINEVVLKYKELNQNKDLSINIFVETKQTEIYYDNEIITIILDNLISNAIKYTPKGTIGIFLRNSNKRGKNYMEIEVRDTGFGIPENVLDKIFNRYYQVKGEYQASGSGIGLALVKNLVQLHEGNIEVKSKLKEGTSFYVQLETENTYPNAEHLEESDVLISKKKKDVIRPLMLLVDDHQDMRKYIADSFSGLFEIIEVPNGKTGVELAIDKMPDIIISDIMMPVMDGISLCKILKEDMRTCHIPIILLTAKDSVYDKIEGYSTGADSYITKPFNANLLQIRVNNLLEARKKITAYFSSNTYKNLVTTDALCELDNQFIEKTTSLIEKNIESEPINAMFLAEQLCMSYSSFSRKIKALTGMTTNELIRKIKLQHAEQMILSRKYNINEVASQLGFNNMSHFRQYFKAEFGVLPSEYLKKIENDNV